MDEIKKEENVVNNATNTTNNVVRMDGRKVVRRNELTEVMEKVFHNMSEMAGHLMSDMNNLFKRFTYPNMIRTNAIENLLIAKGIITKDEVNEEAKRITEEAVAKAKEVEESNKAVEENRKEEIKEEIKEEDKGVLAGD